MEEGKTYIAFYESSDSFIHRVYDAIFYEMDFGQIQIESIETVVASTPDVHLKRIPKYFFSITMKDGLDMRQEPSLVPSIEPFLFRFFQGSQLFEFHSGHYAKYPFLDPERHGCWNTLESRSVSQGKNRNETDFTLQDLIIFTQARRQMKLLYIPQSLASIYEIVSKASKSFESTTLYYYLYATYILYQESTVQCQKIDILCLPTSSVKCQIRVFDQVGNEMARYGFDFMEKKSVFVADKTISKEKGHVNPMCELQCYHKLFIPFRLHVRSFLLTQENNVKFFFGENEISTLYDLETSDDLTRSVSKILISEPLRFELLSSSPSIFKLSKTNKTLEISSLFMSRNHEFIQSLVRYTEECREKISTREKVKILYLLGMFLLHKQHTIHQLV